jgi:hypothetical protein
MTKEATSFNWAPLIGHIVLVQRNPEKPHPKYNGRYEYYLSALSPSGKYLKLETMSGSIFWVESDDYLVVEDLGQDQR